MSTSSDSSVIVVGAGVIGLATAVELAARGFKVTVLDPAPASGASHYAGGMLAPAAEVVYQQDPLFPLMRASGAWYPELIDLVAQHTEVPTGYRAEGTLVVSADRADAQHLTELADYQSLHGMEVERITVREARRAEPLLSPRLAAAVSIPGDTQVFPRQWTAALLSAAQALGVRFFRTAAQSINADTGMVTTAVGEFEAEQVVLAAGLGARDIEWAASAGLEESPLHLRPVYGDILRLRVPDELQPLLTRVVRGFVEDRPIYLIPRGDGTLAVGATTREDPLATAQAGGVYALLRDAIRVLPAVEECEFLEASAGARPGTPDDLPYLGRVSDKLVISTGYFRHGILLTALAARCTRELIEGTESSIDLTACDPLRHLKEQP